jgi:glycosyltransferase 2 family protein
VLPDRFRGPVVRVLGGLLAAATATFVVLEVIRRWDDLGEIIRDAELGWVIGSTVAFMVAEVLYAFAWPATLHRMDHGEVPSRVGAAAFLLAQTAKFVPGGIWPALGRIGTADRTGVPRREVTAGWTIETSATVSAAVLIAGVSGAASHLVFDDVGAALRTLEVVLAVVGAVAVALAGRRAAERVAQRPLFRDRRFVTVLVWHLVVWTLYGVAAGLLMLAFDGPFWPTIGAFAVSWLAGFVVIGAPAGLGVREAVMTAALTPAAGQTTALAVAVGSRALWTLVSLAGAAAALPIMAGARKAADPADDPSLPC